jgi:hypothetical protein
MSRSHRRWVAPVCFLGVIVAGCSCPPAAVYVETTIYQDGSCDRMIWQPKGQFLPDEAKKPEWKARWKEVTDAARPPVRKAPKGPSDERKYFIARGSFKNPREIPAHYRFVNAKTPEAGASELERAYERTDYGFVVEHVWREKITNIVTLTGFVKARDELLDMCLPPYIEAIEKVFGKEYDVSRLVAYLRSDFRRFLENASVLLYDAAVRGSVYNQQNSLDETLFEELFQSADRCGLDPKLLTEIFSTPPNEQKQTRAMKLWCGSLVARYFRHRDGRTLTSAEAEALVPVVFLDDRYDKAIEAVTKSLSDRFGKDEKLQKRVGIAFLHMTGLYNGLQFLFVGQPQYEFAIELPGELIETNGQGTQSGRTRWKFTASEMFPSGYEMKARSIAIDREGQKKVLGRVVIDDEATLKSFLEDVGREGPLIEAVRRLRETGDREVLRRVKPRSYEEGMRADRLRKMLLGNSQS